MSLARARLGRRAEAAAQAHLEAAGLVLVTRNWKAPPHPPVSHPSRATLQVTTMDRRIT